MLCSGVFLVSGCHSASLPAVTLMQTAVGFSFALAIPASELLFFFFFQTIDELLPGFGSQDAGSQQIGFLLGSCGVTLALTTDACQKGLPKAQTGEVATFKGTACSLFWLCVYIISSVLK